MRSQQASIAYAALPAHVKILLLRYSNARLRDASFGGSSYGVAVQKVLVLTDTSADPFHLATGTWQQQDLLDKISESGVVSGISHHEHCLVHLFTAYDIPRGVQVSLQSILLDEWARADCANGRDWRGLPQAQWRVDLAPQHRALRAAREFVAGLAALQSKRFSTPRTPLPSTTGLRFRH